MITVNDLRKRIQQTGAEAEAVAALGLDLEPSNFLSVPDHVVLEAFGEGSVKSADLRTQLHHHPLPDLRKVGIYSDSDMLYHLVGGFAVARAFTHYAERHGKPFEAAERIMDFGCGTSRVLRYMVEFVDGPEFYGSEVFRESVEWGRTAFPEVIYIHQDSSPPLQLDSSFFDIIYAFSIFSHLSEEAHCLWLNELHHLARGGLDPRNFGLTFISSNYISKNWLSRFALLQHDEGAIDRFQDYVILKKRAE